MPKKFLLIGDPLDPHIEVLISCLPESDISVLNQYKPCEIEIKNDGNIYIEGVNIHSFVSVYWRQKKFGHNKMVFSSQEDERFWEEQWSEFFRYIDIVVPREKQIDARASANRASNKIFFAAVIAKIGLRGPEQIVTNSIDKSGRFFYDNDRVVYKRLGASLPSKKKPLLTERVSSNFIDLNAKEFSRTPNLLQNYIDKSYELRVLVVGEDIFTVKIDSQKFNNTKSDWRADQLNTQMFSIYDAPDYLNVQIRKLMRNLQLKTGVIDIIRDVNGSYIFLEINPAGQWLFIELFKEMGAVDSFVNLISSPHP